MCCVVNPPATSIIGAATDAPSVPPINAASIDEVIDRRAIRSVFQPLVRLETAEVVGYEALSRGPRGTLLESPLALLDAARAAGRLAELDWVCRATAVETAMACGLGGALTLFVNVEPDSLDAVVPPALADALEHARGRLRIVKEFTERALARDPGRLLNEVAEVRAQGFGVALDDVGAEPDSLALLPFVRPDVVKLDLRLVQSRTDREIAAIANAVRAYAESSGAMILAEGVETPAHVDVARVLGATYAQGWLYGRPAELPDVLAQPVNNIRLLSAPVLATTVSPYDLLVQTQVPQHAPKRLLLPMSLHLEQVALAGGEPVVVLGCFEEARHFTPATARRYAVLAGRTAFTAAYGAGMPVVPVAGVRGVPLFAGDPLRHEWTVVVVGPHFAGALVARDRGDEGRDSERRFDFMITHDRTLVLEVARSLLSRAVDRPA